MHVCVFFQCYIKLILIKAISLSFSLVFIFGKFQCHGTGHSYGAIFVKFYCLYIN